MTKIAGEEAEPSTQALSLANATSFIEAQFPVSKLSKESYAERRANQSQTITGLGKWWGRKPLLLCRATIVGALLPASDDPEGDRETFLALMTMDDGGMLRRRKSIPQKVVYQYLPPSEREEYFTHESTEKKAKWRRGLSREEKQALQDRVFLAMSYDERLGYAVRPEQIDGPSGAAWERVNAHLGTDAHSLSELVIELGWRRFGHIPRVGDSFCGGGSVPFEAARIGCEAYGSDLNPVAGLLTWAALNIIGGGESAAEQIQETQRRIFVAVDQLITEWGIEHDTDGWRANAYLYCLETRCPECGWMVPLVHTWAVAPTNGYFAELHPDPASRSFQIHIRRVRSRQELDETARAGTVVDARLACPNPDCAKSTPISAIRCDGLGGQELGLRLWENDDLVPRADDVFQERLYCVRWFRRVMGADGKVYTEREYRSVTAEDQRREARVLKLLTERFHNWQAKGYIPCRKIEPGQKTTELIRTRGWTHWHHLFRPRQLLTIGLLMKHVDELARSPKCIAAGMLGVGRCADWDSKLCRWGTGAARESVAQTFSNQALNTLYSYAGKAFDLLDGSWFPISPTLTLPGKATVEAIDARKVTQECDIWFTDPPYADAVNYHELSEFFLSWYDKQLRALFPGWSTDSKRALAVRGDQDDFRKSMVSCYRRLADLMPPNGIQVVMFTHQNSGVWADLAMILWAAGLRVTAAWCVQTEREATGTRAGNYVQGTVLMVLRRRAAAEESFLDEVYQAVELEVRQQLDAMTELDDQEDPNFADTDYQLAAYAAALRVLTQNPIVEIDVEYELSRQRQPGEKSPVQELIDNAVKIACDHLVPRGMDQDLWRSLSRTERMYLKGLEIESHGEFRSGVYQELARGFGIRGYAFLLASTKANQTRLRTATELQRRDLGGESGGGDRVEFACSVLRQALFAVFKITETEETETGLNYVKTELVDYWDQRERLIDILEFLAAFGRNASMAHWHADAESAAQLAGAMRNDHV